MATDLASLDDRLNRVADRLTANVELLFSEIIAFVGAALVITTPVKTGFARANWRPSLNSPSTSPISYTDPTGSATIARIESVGKLWRVGDTAYIVNRAPYIGRLNEGSSPQAPPGFVQAALRDGVAEALSNRRSFLGGR